MMAQISANNATAFPAARKNGKRPHSMKQASPNLFYLWHKLQDIKTEAEQMKDAELVFMIGLVELLVEERATPGAAALATVDTTTPH
jgi:hypothetical protein